MNQSATWTVFIDGASRNNPGKSGAGIVVQKDGQVVIREGFFLGIKTNNQAEYGALLLGLHLVAYHAHPQDTIRIISDSELLIKHMQGVYRVKNEGLQPLYQLAQKMINSYSIELIHVLREHNKDADALANQGIDTKKPLPPSFIALLKQHAINW